MDFQYKEIIDLTIPVITNMSVPPANQKTLPPVEIKVCKNHLEHGIQVGFFQTGIHAGTHLDSPLHIINGGTSIDRLPLDYFFGPAYCIDCSEVKPCEPVTRAMLERAEGNIRNNMLIFLYTGWSDRMFGSNEYWFDSPYLGEDAAQWLVEHKTKIAGFDFFQDIGAKNEKLDPSKFVVHKILLGNGVLNIEHLTNLGPVKNSEFIAIALPLKLTGAEGSPTRVIALR
jgi:kynurenine formamidase